MTKTREDYVSDYLDSVKNLGVVLEPPVQQITKTAEAAWTVDSYNIEPSDEPAEKSPQRRTR